MCEAMRATRVLSCAGSRERPAVPVARPAPAVRGAAARRAGVTVAFTVKTKNSPTHGHLCTFHALTGAVARFLQP